MQKATGFPKLKKALEGTWEQIVTPLFKLLISIGGLVVALSYGGAATAAQQCPDNFVAFRGTSAPLSCTCSAESTQWGGVWGMDVYTEDSSICVAAVHAGRIGRNGGDVTVIPLPGQRAYPGLTRNGIPSGNNGRMEGSFSFAGAAVAQAPPTAPVPAEPLPAPVSQAPLAPAPAMPAPPPQPAAMPVTTAPAPSAAPQPATATVGQCPENFVAWRGETAPLTCHCPPVDTNSSAVWGMDVYTEDSNLCLAAVHAGFLVADGGLVTAVPLPGRPAYAGVTRNGISSSNNGAMEGSFSFQPTTVQARYVPVQPIVQPLPLVPLSQCPDNFVAFRGSSEALSCFCSALESNAGGIWGMDIYSEDSAICLAAVHYGVLTPSGGNVSVLPQPGRKSYAGATRNGVISSNGGAMEGSFSFSHQLVQPVAAPAAPVQLPIAQSLMQTGQVQLYVHFATDSDQLYEDSLPLLNELLAALRANPGLNLKLIGHTDNVGSAGYNQTLSTKRASAVKFWLIQQGILPSRIEAEGRGLSEPLEDNGTDYGRASNRRVQAVRLN
ncbi:LCCL domain-containing protein [Rhizobium sp. RU36D]|uniref:LCCL domain-containing protein n=1 Tax=Rhizobium sp. RU36D TaxID=1907415 RepID=UPI0015C4793E|nr:LCCL domain-containing protein [Rhizobium sp. RU36D]